MKWNKYPEVKPTDENKKYLIAVEVLGLTDAYCYNTALYTKNLYKFDKHDFFEFKGKGQDGFVEFNDEYGEWQTRYCEYWAEIEPPKEVKK